MEIIHIVLGKVNPQRMNGVNKVVYNLASEQSLSGIRVSVWGISGSTEHNYPERNFSTVLFKKSKWSFGLPEGFESAVRGSAEDTVFHIHGGFIPVFYSISKILQSIGRKFVFTPHGSYNKIAWRKSPLRKAIYFRLFEKSMLQRASLIHVLGKSETEGLNSLYPGLQIERIPYGFAPLTKPQVIESTSGEYIVGFCGRLDIYTKGLDALMDGFHEFTKIHENSTLWIIGDGSEKQKLIDRAHKLGILQKVCFWGSRFGSEKDALIAQMHVFAHPSRNEGLPTSVLEAASLGIPCLVTEATNLGDEIRNAGAGIVLASCNAVSVKSGLLQAYKINNSGFRNLIRINSGKMVQDFFNWNHILNRFNSVYTRVLS